MAAIGSGFPMWMTEIFPDIEQQPEAPASQGGLRRYQVADLSHPVMRLPPPDMGVVVVLLGREGLDTEIDLGDGSFSVRSMTGAISFWKARKKSPINGEIWRSEARNDDIVDRSIGPLYGDRHERERHSGHIDECKQGCFPWRYQTPELEEFLARLANDQDVFFKIWREYRRT